MMAKGLAGRLPAFGYRNFRLFWSGQIVSLIGTNMQTAAMAWLVLRLTDSEFALGMISTLSMAPTLFLSLTAGALADRMSKRRMLLAAQSAYLAQALMTGYVAYSGVTNMWVYYGLALLQGLIFAFDAPVRQSFVSEMVGHGAVQNAVSLNSTVFNAARIVGPAIAGYMIHFFGEPACFMINAVSFVAVITGVALMRESELHIPEKSGDSAHAAGMKGGFDYLRKDRRMPGMLLTVAGASLFGMASFVLIPVFAKKVFDQGPKGLGFLMAAAGCGAIVSSITLSLKKEFRKQGRTLFLSWSLMGLVIAGFAFCPDFVMAMVLIAIAGGCAVTGMSITNSTLQTISPHELVGRVISIYVVILIGFTPPGNLLAGWLAQEISPRMATFILGMMAFVSVVAVTIIFPGYLKIDVRKKTD